MYKIYANHNPLYLAAEEELPTIKSTLEGQNILYARYLGKTKNIFNYLDNLEKGSDFEGIVLYFLDLDKLFQDFLSVLKVIQACGGLVEAEGKYLFIFRRGYWDLPKGKMEEGEIEEETAVREVQEETGLKDVILDRFLLRTYHIFRSPNKGTRCLKVSDWYKMHSPLAIGLTPQVEEDIEKAIWVRKEDIAQLDGEMYGNIQDVLAHYFEKT